MNRELMNESQGYVPMPAPTPAQVLEHQARLLSRHKAKRANALLEYVVDRIKNEYSQGNSLTMAPPILRSVMDLWQDTDAKTQTIRALQKSGWIVIFWSDESLIIEPCTEEKSFWRRFWKTYKSIYYR